MNPRRRVQGEGSIYQLPNGKWRALVDLGYVNGKRKRKAATRNTHRDCADWLREMKAAHRAHAVPSRTPTVAEWFETYLKEVASTKVRSSTLANYRRDFSRHIKPGIGRHRLDALRPEHLARFYADRSDSGLSAYAVRYIHASIRPALSIAMRWGLVARNVATMVDPPPLPHHEVEPLSIDAARTLIAAASGDRMEARWLVGLSLGLRQGEVLGLFWEDVDFDANLLRVRRQLVRPSVAGAGLTFGPLKSARSRRTLRLPDRLSDFLKIHRERQAAERDLCRTWADYRLVFTSLNGTPINHRNDTRAFKALLVKAGLDQQGPIRLHDLRHTAASVLLAQNVQPRVVMEILGHSQIGVTMNTYSHVMPTQLAAAAEAINAALWERGAD